MAESSLIQAINMKPAQAIQFYRFARSGHCHRVEVLLSLLGLNYQCIDVNLLAKQQKTPEFLALNPFGQVPVIQDGDCVIADSNAILVYLAQHYGGEKWRPKTAQEAAEIQRWFSLAAGPLAFGASAARAALRFNMPLDLVAAQNRAMALFGVMDAHLARQDFLAGWNVTLADLAHYAYVARAPEGDISLSPYPSLQAWLCRIEALPGFIPMPETPVNIEN